MNVCVRNYHLDGYGHVNSVRYLEFLEETRRTFFEQHGLLSTPKGITLVVARADTHCRRPAVEDDELRFEGRLEEMTPRHIVLTQTIILPNGKNAVEVEIAMMAVNAANGHSTSIPVPLLTAPKTIAAE